MGLKFHFEDAKSAIGQGTEVPVWRCEVRLRGLRQDEMHLHPAPAPFVPHGERESISAFVGAVLCARFL